MAAPLSPKLPWEQANPQWAAALNPVLANAILSGTQVEGITLINGAVTFNHGLGRTPKGFWITDINAAATVYRSQPFNNLTLTLTSNAKAVVNVWVY